MIGSQIERIEYYLPQEILTNEMLSQLFPEWDAAKVEDKVGIRNRHIASENESALDMGIKVAIQICSIENKNSIDYVIFCTQSPEYFLPTGACIIQDKLGLRMDIGAVDINLGCSGYVYGLSLADSLIKSEQATRILLVTSETYSKHIHPDDKGNRSIFGDAASATIVSKYEEGKIHKFVFGTNGNGFNKLIVKKGAFNKNYEDRKYEESQFSDEYLYMNGPDIFNFTMETVPKLVDDTLIKNNLCKDDIDLYIFHQANKYILNFLRKQIRIPKEKFYVNIEETGNTVSSTLPIALKQCIESGRIKPGNRVMLIGFGVGLSWAGTVITI